MERRRSAVDGVEEAPEVSGCRRGKEIEGRLRVNRVGGIFFDLSQRRSPNPKLSLLTMEGCYLDRSDPKANKGNC